MRSCGILLHVTSLPTPGGIGTLGESAYQFIDFLSAAHVRLWQMLPVGPTGYGESPYQSGSTFAGNPMMIDMKELERLGYLPKGAFSPLPDSDQVDFESVREQKEKLLRQAFNFSAAKSASEIEAFGQKHPWIREWALFASLKASFGGKSWMEWPEKARMRRKDDLAEYEKTLKDEIAYHTFVQFLFDLEWRALKEYAHERHVLLFGDMPIYVAEDSADAWAHPENFQFDETRHPLHVAGVPPDYFSADGQLWGNPLYDWKQMKKTAYDWWIKRLAAMGERFDLLRVDHFIGFANYYSIPYGAKNARVGKWITGPGRGFFRQVKKSLPQLRIIAEDLGCVTWRVKLLLRYCGYPGMKVLQFAFGGNEKNPHLPAFHKENCVVYTGTHDNNTTLGWFESASQDEQAHAMRVTGASGKKDITSCMIKCLLQSVADTSVIPMQDILNLDGSARMNTPGTVGNNWGWRMTEMPGSDIADSLGALIKKYNRGGQK